MQEQNDRASLRSSMVNPNLSISNIGGGGGPSQYAAPKDSGRFGQPSSDHGEQYTSAASTIGAGILVAALVLVELAAVAATRRAKRHKREAKRQELIHDLEMLREEARASEREAAEAPPPPDGEGHRSTTARDSTALESATTSKPTLNPGPKNCPTRRGTRSSASPLQT